MPYNVKETVIEYGRIPVNNRGGYICVKKHIPEKEGALQAIDIREMYTDESGEVRFTSRGVRVKEEQYKEVFGAILRALEPEVIAELREELGLTR